MPRHKQKSMRCTACGEMFSLVDALHYFWTANNTRRRVWWCTHCAKINAVSIPSLRAYAWLWFARRVKLDAVESDGLVACITCPKRLAHDDSRLHCGHVIQGLQTKIFAYFDRRACHPQCAQCNIFEHGRPDVYIPWFLKTYGEHAFDELRREKFTGLGGTEDDYRCLIDQYEPPNAFELLGIR